MHKSRIVSDGAETKRHRSTKVVLPNFWDTATYRRCMGAKHKPTRNSAQPADKAFRC